MSPLASTSRPDPLDVVEDNASVDAVKSIVISFAFTVIPLPAPIFRVVVPPRDTDPPSVNPDPAVTVTEEFVSDPFPILLKVFVAPEIVRPAVVPVVATDHVAPPVNASVPVAFPIAVFPVDVVFRFNVGAVITAVPEDSV